MHSQGYIRVRGSENYPRYLAPQRTCAKHLQQILTNRNVIRKKKKKKCNQEDRKTVRSTSTSVQGQKKKKRILQKISATHL